MPLSIPVYIIIYVSDIYPWYVHYSFLVCLLFNRNMSPMPRYYHYLLLICQQFIRSAPIIVYFLPLVCPNLYSDMSTINLCMSNSKDEMLFSNPYKSVISWIFSKKSRLCCPSQSRFLGCYTLFNQEWPLDHKIFIVQRNS